MPTKAQLEAARKKRNLQAQIDKEQERLISAKERIATLRAVKKQRAKS